MRAQIPCWRQSSDTPKIKLHRWGKSCSMHKMKLIAISRDCKKLMLTVKDLESLWKIRWEMHFKECSKMWVHLQEQLLCRHPVKVRAIIHPIPTPTMALLSYKERSSPFDSSVSSSKPNFKKEITNSRWESKSSRESRGKTSNSLSKTRLFQTVLESFSTKTSRPSQEVVLCTLHLKD